MVNNGIGVPGSRGRLIFDMSDLGIIQSPTDTDLYQFRALYTGMAEVRIGIRGSFVRLLRAVEKLQLLRVTAGLGREGFRGCDEEVQLLFGSES